MVHAAQRRHIKAPWPQFVRVGLGWGRLLGIGLSTKSKTQVGDDQHRGASRRKTAKPGLTKCTEEALWQQGYARVAGVDEAGRGPLAGPVVAAACVIRRDVDVEGVMDSKKLVEADRKRLYAQLTSHPGVAFGISVIEPAIIDSINIHEATLRAMEQAVAQLPGSAPQAVLVDGKFMPAGVKAEHQQCIIKGDETCYSIAAAAIIAKVTRDRIMVEAHAEWPQYGFDQHKGYGTKAHFHALRSHGPCPIHRRSFRPVQQALPPVEGQAAESADRTG